MNDLEIYDTEELERELERRKEAEKQAMSKPWPLGNPNFQDTSLLCQQYIDYLYDRGWVDANLKQYIFEAAIEAVFGDDVWSWINSR